MRLVTFGGEGRYSFRFDGITGRRGRPRVCSVRHVTMAVMDGTLKRERDGIEKGRITHCSRTIRKHSTTATVTKSIFIRMFNSTNVPGWIPTIHSATEFHTLDVWLDNEPGSRLSINLDETCGNLYTRTGRTMPKGHVSPSNFMYYSRGEGDGLP